MVSRLLLVAIHMHFLFVTASSGQYDDPDLSYCSTTGNYTGDSQYKKNLDQLLARLPAAADANRWFYKGSEGEEEGSSDEPVFGLIMCFADRNATECRKCLALAGAPAGITTACPGSREVKAAYGACVLRLSAAPIPATADLEYTPGTPPILDPPDPVHKAWLSLMSKLTVGVVTSPLLIYSDSTPYSGPEHDGTMYGLAQCSRDLNASECRSCISNCVDKLWREFPNNISGALRGYSCYLRYQVGAFDVTLPPPELAPPPAPPPSGSSIPTLSKRKTRVGIGMSIILVPFLTILSFTTTCLLLCFLCRRRRKAKLSGEASTGEEPEGEFQMEDEFEKGTGPKRFRYEELAIATNNFSESQKLGEGGFGSVYRGFLMETNLHVAVKRVSKASKQGRKEYASEVRIISRLRHRNLVQLIGWCHDGGELLLVYEMMPNASLDKHLYSTSNNVLLPWPVRHEIVLGLGSALLYLHEEWDQCVVHRDIKPSNVMLDASFQPKLGDFGLARMFDHGRGSHTTVLAGTTGYIDPECTTTGRFNKESDIYSFGVLLLEVACGRRPVVDLPDGTVVHLAQRVSELHERGLILHTADPRLNGDFDPKEMERMLLVGLWCTQPDQCLRPSIRQVVSTLRFETPLPSLPERRMPVATCVPVPFGVLNSGPSSLPVDDDTTTNLYITSRTIILI